MPTKRYSETRIIVSEEQPTEAPEHTVLLPPPPTNGTVDFTVPALPPLGKIRQYESTLWSPAAMASSKTDIDELGPTEDDPSRDSSTKLSSKSRAPVRRRRAA